MNILNLRKQHTLTFLTRTLRKTYCERCGVGFFYVHNCQGRGEAAAWVWSAADVLEEEAKQKAISDAQKELEEGASPIPCPNCGWLQQDMVRRLRSESHALLGVVALLSLCFGGYILFMTVMLTISHLVVLPQPRLIEVLPTFYAIGLGLIGVSASLFIFIKWRAGGWNPNDCDLEEQRKIGRRLALVEDDCNPTELAKLLEMANSALCENIRKERRFQARFQGFALMFVALICVIYLVSEVNTIAEARKTSFWPHTQGKMIQAWVGSEQRGRHTYYWPEVQYQYSVQGIAFTGTKYCLGTDDSIQHAVAERKVRRLLISLDVKVFYNPERPDESVLKTGLPFWKGFFIFLFVALATFLGFLSWISFKRFDPSEHVELEDIEVPSDL